MSVFLRREALKRAINVDLAPISAAAEFERRWEATSLDVAVKRAAAASAKLLR
jgi:hypothetical protein